MSSGWLLWYIFEKAKIYDYHGITRVNGRLSVLRAWHCKGVWWFAELYTATAVAASAVGSKKKGHGCWRTGSCSFRARADHAGRRRDGPGASTGEWEFNSEGTEETAADARLHCLCSLPQWVHLADVQERHGFSSTSRNCCELVGWEVSLAVPFWTDFGLPSCLHHQARFWRESAEGASCTRCLAGDYEGTSVFCARSPQVCEGSRGQVCEEIAAGSFQVTGAFARHRQVQHSTRCEAVRSD